MQKRRELNSPQTQGMSAASLIRGNASEYVSLHFSTTSQSMNSRRWSWSVAQLRKVDVILFTEFTGILQFVKRNNLKVGLANKYGR